MMLLLKNPADSSMVCVNKPDDWDGTTASIGYADWVEVEERDSQPPEFATWVDGQGFVVDEDAKALAIENDRLASLSESDRQAEAVTKAKADIVAALLDAGVMTKSQASSIIQ